jgi:hypothetical protein
MSKPAKPLIFEAALPVGQAFSLTGEGDATLKLAVPEQFARILSDRIHALRNRSFIVTVTGLED